MTRRLKVAFGADDENECVTAVRAFIANNYEIVQGEAGVPWPKMAEGVARSVVKREANFGVVMCWTGTGTAIAANKVAGVRAAQASDPWIATGARLWNDANVLALSLKRLAPEVAVECVKAFLETERPDPTERDNIDLLVSLDETEN